MGPKGVPDHPGRWRVAIHEPWRCSHWSDPGHALWRGRLQRDHGSVACFRGEQWVVAYWWQDRADRSEIAEGGPSGGDEPSYTHRLRLPRPLGPSRELPNRELREACLDQLDQTRTTAKTARITWPQFSGANDCLRRAREGTLHLMRSPADPFIGLYLHPPRRPTRSDRPCKGRVREEAAQPP